MYAYDNSLTFSAGVVSALVTFTGLGSPEFVPGTTLDPLLPLYGAAEAEPVHCGTGMELVTPAVGRGLVGYTFEPDDAGPVQLPPVWRCGCGFQLDAGLGAVYTDSRTAALPA